MSVATFSPTPSRNFSKNSFVAFFFLAGHLSHGIASVTQTLGINNRKLSESISRGGVILAWLVFAGFAVIPVAILLGFLK